MAETEGEGEASLRLEIAGEVCQNRLNTMSYGE